MTASCQYPTGDYQGRELSCGRPAVWETDDLQEIHFLCEHHCDDAEEWNTFRKERLGVSPRIEASRRLAQMLMDEVLIDEAIQGAAE